LSDCLRTDNSFGYWSDDRDFCLIVGETGVEP
jgi:hypothetical protein